MKAHRTDLLSFAFGLVFLGLSAWWLLAQLLGLALPPVGWFLAGALILIGVFGLVGALRSGRPARSEPIATEPIAPTSGATQPTSGVPTSGAALPAWEAERSTWDAPGPVPAPGTANAQLPVPATPTAQLPTPTTEEIHPAWLAHPPAQPETAPVSGRPDDGDDEPTRVDLPAEAVGDQPADEREERRREP
ncbi:hypothetical protein GCM10027614_59110 [Micromonospora vulcania]